MPRGQVLTIPNGTAVLITTLSKDEKASLSMLNPNDGVLYVKMNGTALNTPTMWDWKVPSQSYCQLPGPWESLGVYYQDQSGSARTAEVNVYELDSKISVPSFIAIGRAVQIAGSTVDISSGTQPQNPPAGSARLWVDGNGNLHLLQPNGTDQQEIDSNDALGGILSGNLPNPQYSTGPQNMPALLRITGLGNYTPNSGSGLELYYSGNAATIQAYDRGPATPVLTPLTLQGSNIALSPTGWSYLNKANFQTAIVTNGYNFDTVHTADWFRQITDGYGIYNNASGQGVGLSSSLGVYDYATNRTFAKLPIAGTDISNGAITASQIANGTLTWQQCRSPQDGLSLVQQAGTMSAPSGSTTSGAYNWCPSPFSQLGVYCSRPTTIIAWFTIHLSMSTTGLTCSIGAALNSGSITTVAASNRDGSVNWDLSFVLYFTSPSSGWNYINLAWATNGGTLNWRTDVYSTMFGWEIRL